MYLQQDIRWQIHGAPRLHRLHPPVSGPPLLLGHGVCSGQGRGIFLHQPTSTLPSALPIIGAGVSLPGQQRPPLPGLSLLAFVGRCATQAVPAGPAAGPAAAWAPGGVGGRAAGAGLQQGGGKRRTGWFKEKNQKNCSHIWGTSEKSLFRVLLRSNGVMTLPLQVLDHSPVWAILKDMAKHVQVCCIFLEMTLNQIFFVWVEPKRDSRWLIYRFGFNLYLDHQFVKWWVAFAAASPSITVTSVRQQDTHNQFRDTSWKVRSIIPGKHWK